MGIKSIHGLVYVTTRDETKYVCCMYLSRATSKFLCLCCMNWSMLVIMCNVLFFYAHNPKSTKLHQIATKLKQTRNNVFAQNTFGKLIFFEGAYYSTWAATHMIAQVVFILLPALMTSFLLVLVWAKLKICTRSYNWILSIFECFKFCPRCKRQHEPQDNLSALI